MAVASVTAASKIQMLLCCPFDAMGSTMATYGGQNRGQASGPDQQGLKGCLIIGAVYSAVALGITVLWGKQIAWLFIDKGESQILGQVYQYLLGSRGLLHLLAAVNIVRFLIQVWDTVCLPYSQECEMAARGFTGFILVPAFGYGAVCLGNGLCVAGCRLVSDSGVFQVMKRLRRLFQEEKDEMKWE